MGWPALPALRGLLRAGEAGKKSGGGHGGGDQMEDLRDEKSLALPLGDRPYGQGDMVLLLLRPALQFVFQLRLQLE